jgi:hypothetical protein
MGISSAEARRVPGVRIVAQSKLPRAASWPLPGGPAFPRSSGGMGRGIFPGHFLQPFDLPGCRAPAESRHPGCASASMQQQHPASAAAARARRG